jgi:hypothetical protein
MITPEALDAVDILKAASEFTFTRSKGGASHLPDALSLLVVDHQVSMPASTLGHPPWQPQVEPLLVDSSYPYHASWPFSWSTQTTPHRCLAPNH